MRLGGKNIGNPARSSRLTVGATFFAGSVTKKAGEQLKDTVHHPEVLRDAWMHNVIDFAALPRVMVEPRITPGPSADWFHPCILRQAGPFTNGAHLLEQWVQQHVGHVHHTNRGTGLHHMLTTLSIHDWVLQELKYWPIGSHMPLASQAKRWIRAHTPPGAPVEWQCTAFGIQCGGYWCTRMFKPWVATIHGKGFTALLYADDLLILGKTPQKKEVRRALIYALAFIRHESLSTQVLL